MQPKEFRYSRKATLVYLLVSSALTFACLVAGQAKSGNATYFGWMSAVFAAATTALGWLVVRPVRLVLDSEGFTVSGGYMRRPKRLLWQDASEFVLYQLSRGGQGIGFKVKRALRDPTLLADAPPHRQTMTRLPLGWDQSAQSMIVELNTYRTQALLKGAAPEDVAPTSATRPRADDAA